MPYCERCGAEIPEGSRFCPLCGNPVRIGMERVVRAMEGFWIPRIMAYIIDSVIIGLAIVIILIVTAIPLLLFRPRVLISLPSLLSGLLSVVYFTLMECFYGFTIGKRFMRISVRAVRGGLPTLEMAFIRNVSKIHGILLFIDLILGALTPGDPSQKLSDRYAGTMARRA